MQRSAVSTQVRLDIVYKNLSNLNFITWKLSWKEYKPPDSLNLPLQRWLNLGDHISLSFTTTVGISSPSVLSVFPCSFRRWVHLSPFDDNPSRYYISSQLSKLDDRKWQHRCRKWCQRKKWLHLDWKWSHRKQKWHHEQEITSFRLEVSLEIYKNYAIQA